MERGNDMMKTRSGNIKRIRKAALVVFLVLFVIKGNVSAAAASEAAQKLTIALDPGHGGTENGACYYGIKEKEADLKVAQLVKRELEQYEGVAVVLTREDDEAVGLSERANRAKQGGADILVSLHFNASVSGKSKGASIYISTGQAKLEELRNLADHLLGEFEALGLENAGTIARVTQMGGRRADGSFDDYYGVLRHAYNNGMPSILIEHCYMDSEEDRRFLHSEEGLRQLAKADANGIASYYGLTKKDGTKATAKHAKVFGGTTKGIRTQYFEAPEVNGIRLVEYDGTTPGMASYEVEVEDGVGINSLYLVYRNEQGNSTTISFKLAESLTTGGHLLKAYIPENLLLGHYTLSYIGAYNEAGYDAGYNYAGGSMIGYGKCEWLNTFSYSGEADFTIKKEGSISTAHANLMDYEIQTGLRDRRNRMMMRIDPN